jgi:type I restriction enzyme, S subunit
VTDLPTGWQLVSVGELGDWRGGGTPSKANLAFWSGDIPWVSAKDMKVYRLRDTEDHITQEAVDSSSTTVVEAGTVLLVTRSGILKHTLPVAVTQVRAAINQDLKALTVRPGILPEYVGWVLRAFAQSILHGYTKSGTTVGSVEFGRFRHFQVPIAPPAEQELIVSTIEEQFSRLDAARDGLHRAQKNLRRLREVAMRIPYDTIWSWSTLGEISDVVGGVTKNAKNESLPDLVEVPYLRVANVQRGYLDLSEVTTIRVPAERARHLALQPGDVLLNEGGDRDKLGRGWVWNGEVPGAIHQNHVFRARLDPGSDPRFMSWHANTFGRDWFERHGSQTTNLASISRANLRALPVPLPARDVQEHIADEIDRRLSLVSALDADLAAALDRQKQLRAAILREAFAGQLTAPIDNWGLNA